MRIIGFVFNKILVEKKKEPKGQIKINTNIDIENITKDSLDVAGEILRLSYTYTIKYEPEIGEIVFKGETVMLPEKEKIKDILKDWKKKKIKEEIRIPIFNFIMSKCNLKALQFEDDLNLPPHIPLPRLSKPQQGQGNQANYTG